MSYWPQPWTCEDGGARRWGSAAGLPGLATDEQVGGEPGELFALRHDITIGGAQSKPVEAWVERLDPETLAPAATTPRLPGGPFWPGGIAAHANGDLHMVFGCWAHRLTPALDVVASHRLPVPRPHNSFVVLDGGELVMKDCDAPAGRQPSTVSVLDPETLLPVAPPLRLEEPSIARLSCDGESVIAVGTTQVFRLRLDRDAQRIVVDERWRPRYGPRPGQSFGWDPVITDEHVLWMDNGRNDVDRTMRSSGTEAGPVRLWWARLDDADAIRSAEISGLPYGTESNPPAWDAERRIVVAYDAGNAVLRAWRMEGDELRPLWRHDDFAHAGHIIVFPDTGELVVQDYRDRPALRRPAVRRALRLPFQVLAQSKRIRAASTAMGHDELVVLDLDTGAEKASRCRRHRRPSCSRRPASRATSTTSRSRPSPGSSSRAAGAEGEHPASFPRALAAGVRAEVHEEEEDHEEPLHARDVVARAPVPERGVAERRPRQDEEAEQRDDPAVERVAEDVAEDPDEEQREAR